MDSCTANQGCDRVSLPILLCSPVDDRSAPRTTAVLGSRSPVESLAVRPHSPQSPGSAASPNATRRSVLLVSVEAQLHR